VEASQALPDVLAPGLRVVMVGINPGMQSAAAGQHFANPRNDFWRLLHDSGLVPVALGPAEQRRILDYGIGITNAADRPTPGSGDLRVTINKKAAAQDAGFVFQTGWSSRALFGTLESIAWPGSATTLVVPVRQDDQLLVATVALDALELPPDAANTAGEPVTRGVRLDGVPVAELAPANLAYQAAADTLSMRSALARSVAMAAALQRTAELTIDYAGRRVQFGQPIARFQAVQTHLARLASEAQRVAVVVDAAQAALGEQDDPQLDPALTGAARTLAGEAAIVCARAAHQVHGAIGVTMEYPLQRFTRRLWEWEAGDGTAMRWARRLGADALSGPMRTWQLITGIR